MHPFLLWFTAPIFFLISHVALADYVIDDQDDRINYGPGWYAYPQEIGIQGVDAGKVNNKSYHIAFGSPSVLSMTIVGVAARFYIINYAGPQINAHNGSARVTLDGHLNQIFHIPPISKCPADKACVNHNTSLFGVTFPEGSYLLSVEVPQYTLFDYVRVWTDTPPSISETPPPKKKNHYGWIALFLLLFLFCGCGS